MNPQQPPAPGLHLPSPTSDASEQQRIEATQAYAPQSTPNAAPSAPVQPAMHMQPGPETDGDDASVDAEWVGRAKELVQQYRLDPYLQSRELSKLKAQYLKARYNKDIKVSEDK